MNEEMLFITESTAEEAGLLFIKEVSERAALSEREISSELVKKGWRSVGNDEEDYTAILGVILEAYKKELLVHAIMEKINPTELVKIKLKLSWKNVFNSNLKHFGDSEVIRKLALTCGYPMYTWNGRVYDSGIEYTMKDMGTEKDLGLE